MELAFDSARLTAELKAGRAAALIEGLANDMGLVFPGARGIISPDMPRALAFDAQPELVTQGNAGIPAFLTYYYDPKLIEVLVAPMKAATIAGEVKKGDWLTTTAIFMVGESTGETSAYGDYNANGAADTNFDYPQRQAFTYQVFTQWGERELAMAGLGRVDLAARKNIASALVLNKYQNLTYFFGVGNLQLYGLLNDPNLPAPISATYAWLTNSSATAATIYTDIQRLFAQLQAQSNGTVDQETRMTLAMSPAQSVALNATNQYNVNVFDQVKKNFPNIRIVTAVEYGTSGQSGQLLQLIVDELEGQETLTCAFTEKMRAHNMVVDTSSFRQKKSQGTFGCIIFRPVLIAQMLA